LGCGDAPRGPATRLLPRLFLPVYRLRNDRDWLTEDEAHALRDLLDAYLTRRGDLPDRVHRAISLSEGVVHNRVIEGALNLVVIGLESLLNTNRVQVRRQMMTRIPLLAAEVGVDGVDEAFADQMYDHRSRAAHGAQVPLPPAAPEQAFGGGQIDAAYLAKVALLQDVLRATTRKAIEDPAFAGGLRQRRRNSRTLAGRFQRRAAVRRRRHRGGNPAGGRRHGDG
jgi:hypothetical protein